MTIKQQIRSLVAEAQTSNEKSHIVYAEISEQEIATILQYTGVNTTGFRHILETDRVRHIFKNHGNPTSEASRGNIAITEKDFELLPMIVKDYDTITHERPSRSGNESVMYTKVIGGTVYCVVEVRKKKKTLSLITMYTTKK